MSPYRRTFATLRLALLTLAGWTVTVNFALAQAAPATPEGSMSDYTVPYFIVALGIFLGLFAVLRSTNRRDREGPVQYQEKGLAAEE